MANPVRVVLHGYHLPDRPRELAGEHPSSGPELHYEIAFLDTSFFDYPSRDSPVLEEVLPQLAPHLALPVAPFLTSVVSTVRRLSFRDISKITLCFPHAFTWGMAGESRATFETGYDPRYSGRKPLRRDSSARA